MSVRAIEAEVSIKSGVRAECTIGREVVVEIHDDVNLYSLTVTANGNYEPSEGVDGFSDVTVSVPERIPVTESLSVTENGTYEPTEGIDGYDRVVVNVPPTIPDISPLTVTEDGVYTSSGDGYNPVTVNTGVGALRQEIQSAEIASGCSPLTDGITALTTYANEVTGQEDETLSDAVESLVLGYGQGGVELSELDVYVGLNTAFQDISFAQTLKKLNIIGNVPNSTSGRVPTQLFLNNSVEIITINYSSGWKPSSCADVFHGNNYQNLKRIIFNVDTSNVNYWDRLFWGNNSLNQGFEFLGQPLNFTKMRSWNNVINATKIKEIRFVPNTLSVSPTIADDYSNMFSDETWVSFANCFNDSANGTATIGSNAISTISSINGDVVDGLFVADENGTMTLMDFITTVKGWTVT